MTTGTKNGTFTVVVFRRTSQRAFKQQRFTQDQKPELFFYLGPQIHMQAGLWWELEGQADLEERAKFNCEVQQFSGVEVPHREKSRPHKPLRAST